MGVHSVQCATHTQTHNIRVQPLSHWCCHLVNHITGELQLLMWNYQCNWNANYMFDSQALPISFPDKLRNSVLATEMKKKKTNTQITLSLHCCDGHLHFTHTHSRHRCTYFTRSRVLLTVKIHFRNIKTIFNNDRAFIYIIILNQIARVCVWEPTSAVAMCHDGHFFCLSLSVCIYSFVAVYFKAK